MKRVVIVILIIVGVGALSAVSYGVSNNFLEQALVLQKNNKHKEAEQLFARSVFFNPLSFRAASLYCGELFTQEKLDQTIKYCSRALRLNSKSTGSRNYLALAYFSKKEYKKAIPEFEKVLSTNPQSDFHKERLGLSYYFLGDNENAIKVLSPLREKQIRSASVYIALGDVYLKKANVNEAIRVYQEASTLFPDVAVFQHLEAQTYYYERQYDKALQIWNELFAKEPENLMWKLGVAISHLGLEHYAVAKPMFEEIVKKDPTIPKARRSLGAVYYEEKQYQKALAEFLAAESLNEKDNYAVVKYQLGVTYLALGDKVRAREKLEEYLKVSPEGKYRKDAEEKLKLL